MTARPHLIRNAVRLLALFALAAVCSMTTAQEEFAVRFELKDGATISDTISIVARVTGAQETGVEKVEFLVDDRLQATDTSTPYSFEWDTLNTTEGPHTITATAFDAAGKTARAKITVVVDNELSKGADYHAENALAALKRGEIEQAARFARRALKIAPNNLRAAHAYAGILRQQRRIPEAIAVLEKAEIPESDTEVRMALVGLYIARGAGSDSTEAFLQDADRAVEIAQKIRKARIDAVKGDPARPEVAIQRGDACFAARDISGAIREYQRCGSAETAPVEALNRLLLAYSQAGRQRDADVLLRSMRFYKREDDTTRAVAGLVMLRRHQVEQAQEIVQNGVESRDLASLLIAAHCALTLQKPRSASALIEQATAIAPDLPEVALLQAYVAPDAIEARRAALRAMELDPTLPEPYAFLGFQALLRADSRRFAAAEAFFNFALKRDPKNSYALLGAALTLLARERASEAEPLLNQLKEVDPDAPDAHVVRAIYFARTDRNPLVTAELEAANRVDPKRWNDAFLPKVGEVIGRVYRYRRSPILTPASLYPAKG